MDNIKIQTEENQVIDWEASKESGDTIIFMDIPQEYKVGDWVEVLTSTKQYKVMDIHVYLDDGGYSLKVSNTEWVGSTNVKPCSPQPAQSYEELDVKIGYMTHRDSKKAWQANTASTSSSLCKTEQQALSVQAFAKLTHLYANWVGEYVPDWENTTSLKYCIVIDNFKGVVIRTFRSNIHYLAFSTRDLAGHFLECHRELVGQWMMIGEGG